MSVSMIGDKDGTDEEGADTGGERFTRVQRVQKSFFELVAR